MTKSIKKRMDELDSEQKKKLFGKPGQKNPMYKHSHSKAAIITIKQKLAKYYEENDGYRKNKTFEELFGEEKALKMKHRLSEIASKRTGEKNPFYGKTHNEKTKEKIRKAHIGMKPVNQRPVLVNGIEYPSATEASRQLGVFVATILHRIKSSNLKYANYFYIDEMIVTTSKRL